MRGSRFHPVSRRQEVNRKTARRSLVVVSKVLEIGETLRLHSHCTGHWLKNLTRQFVVTKQFNILALFRESGRTHFNFFVRGLTLCPCAERYYTNSKDLVPRRAQDRCFIFLLFLLGPIYVKQERSYSALQSRLLKD